MKNLKILSMNLGRGFVPIKDKGKREYLMDFIKEEDYDIVMLQGNRIGSNRLFKDLGYSYADSSKNVITLVSKREIVENSSTDELNCSIISNITNPVELINVNCKDSKNFDDVFNICDYYSRQDSKGFVRSRIVAGRFPREVDTNEFCDAFDLEDISTLVGQETHAKNNREMLNHFFISRNLGCMNIHKLVGMTEVSKIGEAYPIEVTLKKVLK